MRVSGPDMMPRLESQRGQVLGVSDLVDGVFSLRLITFGLFGKSTYFDPTSIHAYSHFEQKYIVSSRRS